MKSKNRWLAHPVDPSTWPFYLKDDTYFWAMEVLCSCWFIGRSCDNLFGSVQQTTHHPRKYYLIYSAVQFAVSRSRSRKRHSAPGGCSARNIFWFRCVDWLIQCMEECSGGGAVFFFLHACSGISGSFTASQLFNCARGYIYFVREFSWFFTPHDETNKAKDRTITWR